MGRCVTATLDDTSKSFICPVHSLYVVISYTATTCISVVAAFVATL